jgi:alpha-glucosidase
MVCDYPDAYIGQPGFEIIKKIPGSWDATHVVAAELDKYVSIARRKNDSWYLGTITNNNAREITIDLKFLTLGKYEAYIYSDATDANENANHLTKEKKIVDKNTTLKLTLVQGGGNMIILNKLKK